MASVLVGLSLLDGCAAPATRAAPTRTRAAGVSGAGDSEVETLVRLVNAHRKRRGCPPLRWHQGAAKVARAHSEDMATRRFFGHVNPDGEGPFARLRDAGIGYTAAAENVAAGHTSAASVLEDWLTSRGHRENLEDCAYTHHGIGRVRNRWTHVFLASAPR